MGYETSFGLWLGSLIGQAGGDIQPELVSLCGPSGRSSPKAGKAFCSCSCGLNWSQATPWVLRPNVSTGFALPVLLSPGTTMPWLSGVFISPSGQRGPRSHSRWTYVLAPLPAWGGEGQLQATFSILNRLFSREGQGASLSLGYE